MVVFSFYYLHCSGLYSFQVVFSGQTHLGNYCPYSWQSHFFLGLFTSKQINLVFFQGVTHICTLSFYDYCLFDMFWLTLIFF
jgi:hypothetical protein